MDKREILKKCREYDSSNDYLYYLIHKKQSDTYAVIGAPCNYLFRNDKDQFFGTCIYVSENNLPAGMAAEFPCKKKLFGIPMVKITDKMIHGNVSFLTNPEIRELPFRFRMDSVPGFRSPFIPSYTCFACEDVAEIITPRAALTDLCRKNEDFRSFIERITELFDIKNEQIGIAGSVALGADVSADYDIVFYGDPEELWRIHRIAEEMNRRQGTPKSGNMPIPFRVIIEGRIVDILYVYDRPLLAGVHTARLLKTEVPFRCRVTDDTAALQVEPYLKVDGENFSSLLLEESLLHAVFRTGDMIEGKGDLIRWEHNGKTETMMLCRYPLAQILDYPRYFYRYE